MWGCMTRLQLHIVRVFLLMRQYLLLNPLFKQVTMMMQSQILVMMFVMVALILMER